MISFCGEELIGHKYEPIFDYFKDSKNAFAVLHGDFVSEEEGTGIVHIAPGFGEDDYDLCQKNNIPVVCPVNDARDFTDEVSDFKGRNIFESEVDIIKYLKEHNNWIKTEQYLHNYPHCWRTDTPLIFKAIESWYVKVTDIKDRMCVLNQQINWIPNHIRDGQFGKWLSNAKDWSISRKRFWGCPVPVWKWRKPEIDFINISDDIREKTEHDYNAIWNDLKDKIHVFGSIKELEDFFDIKIEDLHRPFIDSLKKRIYLGGTDYYFELSRVPDVLDCWFESGSMPFASMHYPFENKDWLENHLPAHFITEYIAQTRGWFYTLMILSTAIFDKIPFRNCICHGVILDEDGKKLSKRLKNYPDPQDVFNTFGSDAMRFAMLRTTIMNGEELRIDKEGKIFQEIVKDILNPIHNAILFFKTYSEIDKIDLKINYESKNLMDRYILSRLFLFIDNFQKAMDEYDTPIACQEIRDFIEVLNNWYIRRNKNRFWKEDLDIDKYDAYNTLYTILYYFLINISSLLPFLAEYGFLKIFGRVAERSKAASC